jgi:tripartite-type tricarboxylate transporter receptor subunit TctC
VTKKFVSVMVCVLMLTGLTEATAADFPSRPITVLIGLGAGGSVDAAIRAYGEVISRDLGQPLILDNRPGGGGVTAALALKQAPADGQTIMVALSGLHTVSPAMQVLPFDPIADFEPIMLLYSAPIFLAVPADSPASSVKELIELAKTKPGGLNYGSPAVGSPGHLVGAMLQQKSGAPMTHVPYRGAPPLIVDLIAGRIEMTVVGYVNIKGALDEKKVKVLAVADIQRWPGLPDVPTMAEQGYPGVDVDAWFGLLAPLATPKPVTQRLFDEFNRASRDPDVMKRMDEFGLVIKPKPAQALVELMRSDADRLGKVIKTLGTKTQ